MQSSNRRRYEMFAPLEVLNTLVGLSEHDRKVILAYITELKRDIANAESLLHMEQAHNLDANGVIQRMTDEHAAAMRELRERA